MSVVPVSFPHPEIPRTLLFYASLFSLGFGRETSFDVQLAYGAWMFSVVLLDLGIARAVGHPPVVRRFMAHIRKIERATGVVLLRLRRDRRRPLSGTAIGLGYNRILP